MKTYKQSLLLGLLVAALIPGHAYAQATPQTGQTYRTPLNIETAGADLLFGPRPARPARVGRTERSLRPERPARERVQRSALPKRPARPGREERSVFDSSSPTGFYSRDNQAPVNGAFDIIGNAVDSSSNGSLVSVESERAALKNYLQRGDISAEQRLRAAERLLVLEKQQ